MAAIKLPYQIQNNGDWGIVLANQVYGGVHYKQTHDEMEAISINLKQPGMLCYVQNDTPKKEGGESKPVMYQWDGNVWLEFGQALGGKGGIMCVRMAETKEYNTEGYEDYNPELYDTEVMSNGSLIYVEDSTEGGTYMQCVVEYDDDGNPTDIHYTKSINGFDPLFRCDANVPEAATNVQVGNMKAGMFTRMELEHMGIDRILSYIMFREEPPFVNAGSAELHINTPMCEVGTPITLDMFNARQLSQYAYGYLPVDGEIVTMQGDYAVSDVHASVGSTVELGRTATNKGDVEFYYDGEDTLLYTSWGNDKYEGETYKLDSSTLEPIVCEQYIQGYYDCYYVNGNNVGNPSKPLDDIDAFSEGFFDTLTPQTTGVVKATDKITSTTRFTTQTLTIGTKWEAGGLSQTAFVYVMLPSALKVDTAYVRNSFSGNNDELPVQNITKTELTNSIGNLSQYNEYTVWQIAKFTTPNSDGSYPPTNQPIKIKVSKI